MTTVLRLVVLGFVALSTVRTAAADSDGLLFLSTTDGSDVDYEIGAIRTDLANCPNDGVDREIGGYQFAFSGGGALVSDPIALKPDPSNPGSFVQDHTYQVFVDPDDDGTSFTILAFTFSQSSAALLLPPCIENTDAGLSRKFLSFTFVEPPADLQITEVVVTDIQGSPMDFSLSDGTTVCDSEWASTHDGLEYDCNGECLGAAEIDPCGGCRDLGPADPLWQVIPEDDCDCLGNKIEDVDCTGVCGSTDVGVDACGTCGGTVSDVSLCCDAFENLDAGDVDQENGFDIEDAKALADILVNTEIGPNDCVQEVLEDFVNTVDGTVDLHDVLGLVKEANK